MAGLWDAIKALEARVEQLERPQVSSGEAVVTTRPARTGRSKKAKKVKSDVPAEVDAA